MNLREKEAFLTVAQGNEATEAQVREKAGMYRLLITAALYSAVSGAQAQEVKQVGTWMVQTQKDRFTDGTNVMALTINNGGVLAVRCLSPARNVTLAIKQPNLVKDLTAGKRYLVSYKGGKSPVLTTLAEAVGTDMLEVFVTTAMRPTLLTADEYAFRFQGENEQFDVIFEAGTASKALPPVLDACPPKNDDKEPSK
jgi:hypothetical protein